jgi:hypothetical protein
MGNGEWGMGNGEWGMGNGEWGRLSLARQGVWFFGFCFLLSEFNFLAQRTPHPQPLSPKRGEGSQNGGTAPNA